jgi:septal ring factor EnvC (AmiA/AmiB activator)
MLQRNATPFFERMRLVIALTEVNSHHLRGESRRAGAEIELACAVACEKRDGVSSDRTRNIAQLRQYLYDAERALRAIESERAQLEAELANLDSATAHEKRGGGQ